MLGCFGRPTGVQYCGGMGAANTKEAFRTAVLDLVNNQQVREGRGQLLGCRVGPHVTRGRLVLCLFALELCEVFRSSYWEVVIAMECAL